MLTIQRYSLHDDFDENEYWAYCY